MTDILLTPHFALHEFINSPTAKARGIDNTPSVAVIANLKALCENVLEPLRQAMGVPITIGSGYRCPALNKAVGGVSNSQHMTGQAADLHLPDASTGSAQALATGRRWFDWIRTHCKFDQLIMEKSTPSSTRFWIHVSFSLSRCRMQVIECLIKNK